MSQELRAKSEITNPDRLSEPFLAPSMKYRSRMDIAAAVLGGLGLGVNKTRIMQTHTFISSAKRVFANLERSWLDRSWRKKKEESFILQAIGE